MRRPPRLVMAVIAVLLGAALVVAFGAGVVNF